MKNFKQIKKKSLSCFTLIELLVVMGILGILMAVTILVINPAEYLKRARDTNRISDLNTLKTALTLYTVDTGNDFSTPDNTVYVSLPDTSSTCATWSLPALPSPWVYKCVTTANYRKIDGTGWVPVNLSVMASRPLSALPIDPTNNSTFYYTFVKGGSFELTALMESSDGLDKAKNDGGINKGIYETGTNLTLSPWVFGTNSNYFYDFKNWTISGSSAVINSANSISFNGTVTATSDYIPTIGTTLVWNTDARGNDASVNVTIAPNAAAYFGTKYYDCNFNSVLNSTGWAGNGNAPAMSVGTWTTESWSNISLGPNVCYTKIILNSANGYGSTNIDYKNISLTVIH